MKDHTLENLLWFRKYFPEVYHQLRNRQPDNTKVRLTAAKNEQNNIEIYVENVWVSLSSRYNPEQEAYRWAHQFQFDTEELILIGVGLGYHIKALLDLHPHVKLHVFEPNDQILLAALQGGIFFDLPASRISSMSVGSYGDEEKFRTSVRQFFQPILNRVLYQKVNILFLPSYQRWFQKENQIISEIMKKLVVNERIEMRTTLSHEQRWTLNALKNLPYTLATPSVSVLKKKTQGHPLIIVSSGPSMEKEVDVLKQSRKNAIILAAGSSVNGLVHHGILPHAVISFDPAPQNKKVFDLLSSYGVQIPFIFGTTIYHEILSAYNYRNLFHVIISQDTITPLVCQRLGDAPDPILSDAPTVAVLALQLAVYWGCNPIIFVGQDLATPDNKFYASGVSHLREQYLSEEERKQYVEVEKVGGGTVLSSMGFNRMRENMEGFLNQVSRTASHFLFINTSADGARIHGTVEMPLSEALKIYGADETEYDQWFEVDTSQSDSNRLVEAKRYLDELFSQQPELDSIVEELAHIHRRLQEVHQRALLPKIFNRLDQMMSVMEKHRLFQVLYQPMLRTQLDLYNRMAAEVHHQPASDEKSRLVRQRLEGILTAYQQSRNLLDQSDLIPSSISKIKEEKVTD